MTSPQNPVSPAPPPGYDQPVPPPPPRTNTMAVLALVFAFVFSPLGIVFGVIARKQIRRTGEGGRGLATSGLVLGIVFTTLGLLAAVGVAVLISKATPTVSKDGVAQQISEQLQPRLGHRPDSVSCPQDLPATVGASVRCTLTDGGQSTGVNATITSVSDGIAHFTINVE